MNYFINQRVKEYIEYREIKAADFAKSIGLNSDRVSKWFRIKEKIPGEHVIVIIETYKDLNARWLLTGEGTMLSNVVYDIDKENHDANGEEGDGAICTNPYCKKEIAYLKEIINSKEEALKLYREAAKKETGNGNYIQSPQDTKRDKAS